MTKEFVVIATITIIALMGISFTIGTHKWNLNQQYFPCAEDEVLKYDYRNKVNVMCVHIDELASTSR